MKVVVTGGAGFIGANVCRALAACEEVERVVAFDDLSTGAADNLDGVAKVDLVLGTILDPVHLRQVIGSDTAAVVHLAARPSVPRSLADPMASHEANATGTLRILEAMRAAGVTYGVVASSSSVYGSNTKLPKHEAMATTPLSPYAASKLAAESYALSYSSSFGIQVLALRFFNVFGPFQRAGHAYAAVIPAFATAALRGHPLQVHGDGKQTRDFTYVATVADVIKTAVLEGISHPSPVNLAYGHRTDLLTIITMLETLLEKPLVPEFGPPRTGDVRDSQAENSILRSLFPDLQEVPLDEALEQTVAWIQHDLGLDAPGTHS